VTFSHNLDVDCLKATTQLADDSARDSDALAKTLEAAEEAVRKAAVEAHGEGPFDAAAVADFEGAASTIRRWRMALTAGRWPGRIVDRE
jgi:hypothetical protein